MLPSAKKPQVSRTNSLARINDSSQGLFSSEHTLPQEVSKQTGNGWPFTKRADSKQLIEKVLKNNLFRKYFINSHPQFKKIDLNAKDSWNSSDGQSETSLSQLLQEMSDDENETAVDKINSIDWSEQALLF